MMNLSNLLTNLNSLDDDGFKRIEVIDGDIVGTSLFVNILLSFGAFLTSIFSLIFIMSMSFLALDFNEDVFSVHLTFAAITMIGAGYMTHSATGLFGLRISTFFMLFGKTALITLIFERIGAYMGYDNMLDRLQFFTPIAVLLAFANMYVAKIKLEIYLLLTACVLFASFFSSSYSIFYGFSDRQFIQPFAFEFWVRCALWVWAIVMLLKFNSEYKNRLPFYAFISAQLVSSYAMSVSRHDGVFELLSGFNLILIEHVVYNLLLAAPTLFLILKLQKASEYKFSWQFMACFGVLLIATILPISNLLIIIFCFIYGYAFRDKFILVSAYIFTPTLIYNLYNDFSLTLDSASLLAMIIGITALLAWGVTKFTKYEKQEA
ncbi:MAG: hypothetical protein OCD03_04920 [Hyphomicrobiales bacterium]